MLLKYLPVPHKIKRMQPLKLFSDQLVFCLDVCYCEIDRFYENTVLYQLRLDLLHLVYEGHHSLLLVC